MTNFSEESIRRIIFERNTDEMKKAFHDCPNNGHKVAKLWESLAEKLKIDCTGPEIKQKYNNLLKQFRQKKLLSEKSGEGKISWPYFKDFMEVDAKGTEIIAPGCIDSELEVTENSKCEEYLKLITETKKNKTISTTDKLIEVVKTVNGNYIQFLRETFLNKKKGSEKERFRRVEDEVMKSKIEVYTRLKRLENNLEANTKTQEKILEIPENLSKKP